MHMVLVFHRQDQFTVIYSKQRNKLNSTYSSWEKIPFGVQKRSILGPTLFSE